MTLTDQVHATGSIEHASTQHHDKDPRRAERVRLTRRLLAEAAAAEPRERERLLAEVVLANRCVAQAVARRYRNRGVEDEDLYQVAYEGLVRAVARYDTDRADDLLTYAVPVIRGGIQRHFRDRCWDVRPPRRIQVLQGQLNLTIDRLRSQLGREPTREELCSELDVTADELNQVEAAFGSFTAGSLDREIGNGTGLMLADVLADEDGDPQAAEARVLLAPVIRSLSERDRRILYLRFFEDRTQQEIGEEIGVTQMQVSRLLSRITAELRESLGETTPA
jgi:RNA polymerase sigma-B factor